MTTNMQAKQNEINSQASAKIAEPYHHRIARVYADRHTVEGFIESIQESRDSSKEAIEQTIKILIDRPLGKVQDLDENATITIKHSICCSGPDPEQQIEFLHHPNESNVESSCEPEKKSYHGQDENEEDYVNDSDYDERNERRNGSGYFTRSSESQSKPKTQSSYSREHDKFKKPKGAERTLDFRSIYKPIGYGRSGEVNMAKLSDGRLVAMKAVDMYNRAHLIDDLVNEARILYYAQSLGLRCTPAIFYSGYEIGVYCNLIEYLSPKEYYIMNSFDDMTVREFRMLYDALVELASNSIVNRDIDPSHLFFARDGSRCVIIDYGHGHIEEHATELELEFDFQDYISSDELFPPADISLLRDQDLD